MIRKAFIMSVNAGQEGEYERRHRPIWKELEETLKAHGVHNYSIYLHPQTRQLFGYAPQGLQGPDLRQADNAMTPVNEQITDATNLTFLPTAPLVTFDYNQDSVVNGADYTALRSAVLSLVQRYYAPFDVNVQIAP